MKIFEIEFVYDDYDKQISSDTGSRKNPLIAFSQRKSINLT